MDKSENVKTPVSVNNVQESAIVSLAADIFRKRTIGKLPLISGIDEPFFALQKKDENHQFSRVDEADSPELLRMKADRDPNKFDMMSVRTAIEEAVYAIMGMQFGRKKPTLEDTRMEHVGHKVLKRINAILGGFHKITPPSRLVQAYGSIISQNRATIYSHELVITRLLREYFGNRKKPGKRDIFRRLHLLLHKRAALIDENTDILGSFNLSEFMDAIDQNSSHFIIVELDETDSVEIRKSENIAPSRVEQKLRRYVSRDVRNDPELFRVWYEWGRSGVTPELQSQEIADYPHVYDAMINTVLSRKLLIYAYADRVSKIPKERQKLRPEVVSDITHTLPALREEIRECRKKIAEINNGKNGSDVTNHAVSVASGLEEFITNLFIEYSRSLYSYMETPDKRSNHRHVIIDLEAYIFRLYQDLENHINGKPVASDYLHRDMPSEELAGAIDAEAYTADPEFFTKCPRLLLTPLSESENSLVLICGIDSSSVLSRDHLKKTHSPTLDMNPDGTVSGPLDHMKNTERALGMVLVRKLCIFFHAQEQSSTAPNPEISSNLKILRNEILYLHEANEMLSHRIIWLTAKVEQKEYDIKPDLNSEILSLRRQRLGLLKCFADTDSVAVREELQKRILVFCGSIKSRSDMIFDNRGMKEKAPKTIAAETASQSEWRLMEYVPKSMRKDEAVFQGSIPLEIDDGQTVLGNNHEIQKRRDSYSLERKTIIHFFAVTALRDIEDILRNNKGGISTAEFVQKRAEITGNLPHLAKEITLLQKVKVADEDGVPGKKMRKIVNCPKLWRFTNRLSSQLDGILAYMDEHPDAIDGSIEAIENELMSYGLMLQEQITILRKRIWETESIGDTLALMKGRNALRLTVSELAHQIHELAVSISDADNPYPDIPWKLFKKAQEIAKHLGEKTKKR